MQSIDTVSVQALIDEALAVCVKKRTLAARLGLTEQNLQGVIRGRRHLTTAQALSLAQMIDRPAAEVLAVVAIERETDEGERERLRAGFFGLRTVGGLAGALVLAGALGLPSDSAAGSLSDLTIYTLCAVLMMLRTLGDCVLSSKHLSTGVRP